MCKKGDLFTYIISINKQICLNLFFNKVGTFKSVGDMLTEYLVLFDLPRSITISALLISIDLRRSFDVIGQFAINPLFIQLDSNHMDGEPIRLHRFLAVLALLTSSAAKLEAFSSIVCSKVALFMFIVVHILLCLCKLQY